MSAFSPQNKDHILQCKDEVKTEDEFFKENEGTELLWGSDLASSYTIKSEEIEIKEEALDLKAPHKMVERVLFEMSAFSPQNKDHRPRCKVEIKTEDEFFEENESTELPWGSDMIKSEEIEIKEEALDLEAPHKMTSLQNENQIPRFKGEIKTDEAFLGEHDETGLQVPCDQAPNIHLENMKINQGDSLLKIQEIKKTTILECTGRKESCLCEICLAPKVTMCRRSNRLRLKSSAVKSFIERNEEFVTSDLKSESLKCTVCSELFSTKMCLKKHIQLMHEKYRPFKCLKCDKSYFSKYHFNFHVKTCHEKLREFKCSDCGHSFITKQCLSMHVNSVHKKIKPFKCLQCYSSYSDRQALSYHIKSVHDKFKPFICSECNFACIIKSQLFYHIKLVHEQFRPLNCAQCNYTCVKNSDLEKHVKAVHENLRPFVCSITLQRWTKKTPCDFRTYQHE